MADLKNLFIFLICTMEIKSFVPNFYFVSTLGILASSFVENKAK